jgi:hypothetical protein
MAYFRYQTRQSTDAENWAMALPERERGVMRPHHDRWGLDLGTRLTAKVPFYVGDFLIGLYEEFVIIEKAKSANTFKFALVRNDKIVLEASAEEIDSNFYATPGQEMIVKSSAIYPLLGGPEKPGKV